MSNFLYKNLKIASYHGVMLTVTATYWVYPLEKPVSATSNQTYYYGRKGCEVEELQKQLDMRVTGKFDLATAERIASFQRSQGIRITGVADSSTLKALLLDPLSICKYKKLRQGNRSFYDRRGPRLPTAPISSTPNRTNSVVVGTVDVSWASQPIDRPISVRPPVVVRPTVSAPYLSTTSTGSYTVVVPGNSDELLNQIRQYVPNAFLDEARQGSFINAGKYGFDYAQSISSLLRSRGFDARVVYFP